MSGELVDYDSDLYYYDSYICYDHPDCDIVVLPDVVTGSGGSQAVGEFAVAYPYFTAEQVMAWLNNFKKKKVKIRIKVKVNEKEHISFTDVIELDNFETVKNFVIKAKNVSEKVLEKPKNIVVKLNKIEKIS